MEKIKCRAHSKRSGEPCKRWAVPGATVCVMHGGAAPQVKAAAQGRVVAEQARAAVRKMGWTAVTDPLTALGEVAGEMVAMKDRLGSIVDQMTDDALTPEFAMGNVGEQMRAQVTAYTALLNSLVTALSAMGKLNIDERLAKINEAQANGVIAALRIGLAAIGINGEQARTAELAAGRHLVKLGAGS